MEGNCQFNNVVNKCDVIRPLPRKVYLGHAEGEWKSRFYNQKLSFKHKRYSNKTTLSSYMWHLKSVYTELNVVCSETCTTILKYPKEMPFVLIWKTGISCLSKPEETLEQGSELLCKCCRANKLLLKNYTGNDFRRLAIISRKKN